MTAEIINIGDELLIGQVVNTNASWMAAELNKAGITVRQINAIADDSTDIKRALDLALEKSGIVLISGGLGPTKDDITKKTLAEYFDSEMVFHDSTLEQVKKIFTARHFKVTEVNRQQALIPEKCTPLFNENGTAPGMWFETHGKIVVSMPGVPFEMKAMMIHVVIPKLIQYFHLDAIVHKTVMTTGLGESFLAEKIKDWENNLPSYVKLAYLPQPGIVRLRLSAKGPEKSKLDQELEQLTHELEHYIPNAIFGYCDCGLEEVVGNMLKEKKKTIAAAESCTGGYLSHLITSISGSSAYFKGTIVSYDNEVKVEQLGVLPETLDRYGAVSKEVVEQMALGARKRLQTDYALAISGIAGPDGGTDDKPVGTTWIALASAEGVQVQHFHFGEHRGRNIRRAALAALNVLRLELNQQ